MVVHYYHHMRFFYKKDLVVSPKSSTFARFSVVAQDMTMALTENINSPTMMGHKAIEQ